MKHDDTIEEKVPPEGAEMGEQASEEQDQEKLYPVRLKDLEEPIQEDCSSDAIPYRTTYMEGKKKVLVPELISMTKVLFDNYRLPLYSYLNRCLCNGNLAGLVGSRILNDRIRRSEGTGNQIICYTGRHHEDHRPEAEEGSLQQ